MPLSDAWIDFLAGWCSGGAAVVACQPVDTVLTRLQAGLGATAMPITATTTAAQGGQYSLAAFWRGSFAMIGAVPIQSALLMGGYGVGKRWSEENALKNSMGTGTTSSGTTHLQAIFVGGCVGGILQSFLMSPVELIKVHQQIHTEQSALAAGRQVVAQVLQHQPATSAWRGLGATLLRDGIPHGVWFVSYDVCKNYLEQRNQAAEQKSAEGTTDWSVPLASGAFAATVAWVRRNINHDGGCAIARFKILFIYSTGLSFF